MVGTQHYMAPEVYNKNYSSKSDIFSLGVLFYQMLFRSMPFKPTTSNTVPVYADEFESDVETLSPEGKDLLMRMLAKEEDRISWEDLEKHPFLRHNDNIIIHTLELTGALSVDWNGIKHGSSLKNKVASEMDVKSSEILLFYTKDGELTFEIKDEDKLQDLYIRKSTYLFVVPKTQFEQLHETKWTPVYTESKLIKKIHRNEPIPNIDLHKMREKGNKIVEEGFQHVEKFEQLFSSALRIVSLWKTWILTTNTQFEKQVNAFANQASKILDYYVKRSHDVTGRIELRINNDENAPPVLRRYLDQYFTCIEQLKSINDELKGSQSRVSEYGNILRSFSTSSVELDMKKLIDSHLKVIKSERDLLKYENRDQLTMELFKKITRSIYRCSIECAKFQNREFGRIVEQLSPLKNFDCIYGNVALVLSKSKEVFKEFDFVVKKLHDINRCEVELERRIQWSSHFEKMLIDEHHVLSKALCQEDERRDYYDIRDFAYSEYIQQVFKDMKKDNLVIFDFEDPNIYESVDDNLPQTEDYQYSEMISSYMSQLEDLVKDFNNKIVE